MRAQTIAFLTVLSVCVSSFFLNGKPYTCSCSINRARKKVWEQKNQSASQNQQATGKLFSARASQN